MIDLILLVALGASAAAGWWACKTFGTVANMHKRARDRVRRWLS